MKTRIFDRAMWTSQTFKCYSRSSNQITHYFIKRPVNKRYPSEIRNSDNAVVKNNSENDDVVDYGL